MLAALCQEHLQCTGVSLVLVNVIASLTSISHLPVCGWHCWLVQLWALGKLMACKLAAVLAPHAHLWPLQTRHAYAGGTAQDPRPAGEGWGRVLP